MHESFDTDIIAAPESASLLLPDASYRLGEPLLDMPEGLPLYSHLPSSPADLHLQRYQDTPRFWPFGSAVNDVDADMEEGGGLSRGPVQDTARAVRLPTRIA